MKLTKRLFTLLLCLCMVLPLIPAVKTEAVLESSLKYRIYGDRAQITGYYSKPSGDITIPSKVNGYTVYSIGPKAFEGCTGITSVTFPDTIELIGSYAFSGCSNLASVYLGKNAKLNTSSFYNCTKLTYCEVSPYNTILSSNGDGLLYTKDKTGLAMVPPGISGVFTIPDTVSVIFHSAFINCKAITDIIIPSSITTIMHNAFEGCTGLTKITIPEGVATLESNLFIGCTGITDLTIPASVQTIDKKAFANMQNLDTITFLGDAPKLSRFSEYSEGTFYGAEALVLYPKGNSTWDSVVGQNYGGKIKWQAYQPSDTPTLMKLDGKWKYYQNGVISSYNDLLKYNGEWWYVKNGTVASDYSGLQKYNGSWWYICKGKLATKTTTLVKHAGEWWYVVNGKLNSNITGLVKYNGEWWYVQSGKVASKTTKLMKIDGIWYYIQNGKLATKSTTLVNHAGSWWYIKNGQINYTDTTLVKYNGTWYYVNNGKVNFKASGFCTFNYKKYYVNKGVAQTGTSGKITYNGKTYFLRNGALTDCHTAGHSYQAVTCTMEQICIKCLFVANPALGHKFQDGTCTRCGYSVPTEDISSNNTGSGSNSSSSSSGGGSKFCGPCQNTGRVDCLQCVDGYMSSGKPCTSPFCTRGTKDCPSC